MSTDLATRWTLPCHAGQQSQQRLDQRGLASAVGAGNGDDLSRCHVPGRCRARCRSRCSRRAIALHFAAGCCVAGSCHASHVGVLYAGVVQHGVRGCPLPARCHGPSRSGGCASDFSACRWCSITMNEMPRSLSSRTRSQISSINTGFTPAKGSSSRMQRGSSISTRPSSTSFFWPARQARRRARRARGKGSGSCRMRSLALIGQRAPRCVAYAAHLPERIRSSCSPCEGWRAAAIRFSCTERALELARDLEGAHQAQPRTAVGRHTCDVLAVEQDPAPRRLSCCPAMAANSVDFCLRHWCRPGPEMVAGVQAQGDTGPPRLKPPNCRVTASNVEHHCCCHWVLPPNRPCGLVHA